MAYVGRAPPIGFVPTSLAEIARLAEHLKVVGGEAQMPVVTDRLDVVDNQLRAVRFPRAAGLARAARGLDRLIAGAGVQPFRGPVEFVAHGRGRLLRRP